MWAENRKFHFNMLNTLDYQIMQSKLQQASFSGMLYNKQQALNYYINQMGNSVVQHEATFKIVAKKSWVYSFWVQNQCVWIEWGLSVD